MIFNTMKLINNLLSIQYLFCFIFIYRFVNKLVISIKHYLFYILVKIRSLLLFFFLLVYAYLWITMKSNIVQCYVMFFFFFYINTPSYTSMIKNNITSFFFDLLS